MVCKQITNVTKNLDQSPDINHPEVAFRF